MASCGESPPRQCCLARREWRVRCDSSAVRSTHPVHWARMFVWEEKYRDEKTERDRERKTQVKHPFSLLSFLSSLPPTTDITERERDKIRKTQIISLSPRSPSFPFSLPWLSSPSSLSFPCLAPFSLFSLSLFLPYLPFLSFLSTSPTFPLSLCLLFSPLFYFPLVNL